MKPARFLLPALAFVLLTGCELTDSSRDDTPTVDRVIVANGGNFSDQNGHLTIHDTAASSTVQGTDLGGFVHDVVPVDPYMAVLVNTFGEGRIELLDGNTLERDRPITVASSPRSVVALDGTLWVAMFAFGSPGQLVPIALDSGQAGDAITVGDVPESVVVWQGQLVVANNGSLGAGTTLSVVDPATGAAQSVETGCDGPRDLIPTSSSLVLVCTGKTVYSADFSSILEQTSGQVVFFDTSLNATGRIALQGQASSTNGTRTATYSEATDELFVTVPSENAVVIVDVESRAASGSISVPDDASLTGLSGIAYDAERDVILIGRFPVSSGGPFADFAAAGTIQAVDRTGTAVSAFPAGASISAIRVD